MKAKKTALILGAVGLVSLPWSVLANSGTIFLEQGPYSYYVGGEFTAFADPSIDGNYASDALYTIKGDGTGFQTFCVQTTVTFYPGTTYNYSESLASVGSPDAFPLSQGAAWLYSEFAQGALANYDYANTGTGTSLLSPGLGATRQTDAGVLQAAIWFLQGDQTYYGYPNGGPGNIYYNAVSNALGANVDAAATGSANDYGVEVLNLTTVGYPSQQDQNQLVYLGGVTNQTRVPDRGATLALLALSLAGLAVFARRLGAVQRAL
jgi:hypothetical protein